MRSPTVTQHPGGWVVSRGEVEYHGFFQAFFQPESSQTLMPTWTYWGTPVFGLASSTRPFVVELVKRAERIVCSKAERCADGIRRTPNLSNAEVLPNACVDELRAHPPDFAIWVAEASRLMGAPRTAWSPQQEKGRQALA